ncbi:ABC transporter ATP-binding protein [Nonomuraea diastatica]|uniref:ABC transporter ATP-binding protein n=1 Tax=Nonomuraea diastatica TaxID=1848329 RepID=UPI001FE4B383|nr:ABC transporter ATP-binding protein [Nonomuraea diastatica]
MAEPVIELAEVCREFPAQPPVRALDRVTLRVDRGDYLAVAGPSGSGKSTLLNVLGLLDRPSSGSYRLDGTETTALRDGARTRLRGDRIGFVFQSFHLLPHRSVVENVMLAEVYRGRKKAGIKPADSGGAAVGLRAVKQGRGGRRARAKAALERVGVAHRAGFLPGLLSGGERQRAAIARALMGEPSLLLCDEPTGNLDSRNTEAVLGLFDELRGQGLTIVVITHEREVGARAERRVRITDGVLVEED